ncbi:MAG TPA: hypothetical protein VMU22_03755 [Rhizomicrobium sp.]|nr:hypothetical protein [Rhizomicrobium sp.]
MDASALRASFGQPAYVRKDNGSQMWRYDGATCKAFFFLYPGATGAIAVRHVETLPRGTQMAADENCLAQLRVKPVLPASPRPTS